MIGTRLVVIGGAGLIGGAVARALCADPGVEVVIVDRLGAETARKWRHLPTGLHDLIAPERLDAWLASEWRSVAGVHYFAEDNSAADDADRAFAAAYHGARAAWGWCLAKQRPFTYASSAQVYGAVPAVASADPDVIASYQPQTAFGRAKQLFDLACARDSARGAAPPRWTGLRLFTAYGEAETHKGPFRSLPHRAAATAAEGASAVLWRSMDPRTPDGGEARDYVHADDVGAAAAFLSLQDKGLGLIEVGAGQLYEALDVARWAYAALNRQLQVTFADPPPFASPPPARAADLSALRAAGFEGAMRPAREGVAALARALAA
jgi:nucleoside-diphosphate-sugar epimerase